MTPSGSVVLERRRRRLRRYTSGTCRQVVELLTRGTVSCCEGHDLADVAAVEMLERSRLGHRQHEKRLVREPLTMHPYVSAGSARSATSICVELAGRCVNRLRLLHALKDEAVLRRSNRPPSRPGALRFTIQSDGQSGGRRPGIPGRLRTSPLSRPPTELAEPSSSSSAPTIRLSSSLLRAE